MWIKTTDKLPSQNEVVVWYGKRKFRNGIVSDAYAVKKWPPQLNFYPTHWVSLPSVPTADTMEGANLHPPTAKGMQAQTDAPATV